jgi:hypothetical protein
MAEWFRKDNFASAAVQGPVARDNMATGWHQIENRNILLSGKVR